MRGVISFLFDRIILVIGSFGPWFECKILNKISCPMTIIVHWPYIPMLNEFVGSHFSHRDEAQLYFRFCNFFVQFSTYFFTFLFFYILSIFSFFFLIFHLSFVSWEWRPSEAAELLHKRKTLKAHFCPANTLISPLHLISWGHLLPFKLQETTKLAQRLSGKDYAEVDLTSHLICRGTMRSQIYNIQLIACVLFNNKFLTRIVVQSASLPSVHDC